MRKYLKNSDDEESSQDQITPKTTPKRPKNVKRLKTRPIEGSPIIKPKKVISKDSSQNYLAQGNNFKQRWTTYLPNSLLSKLLVCKTFELKKI